LVAGAGFEPATFRL